MGIGEIYRRFPTEDACIEHLEMVRWNGSLLCPYCKSPRVTSYKGTHRHHCNNCNTSFRVTVGTIFHHTHLPLQKWFLAVSIVLNAKAEKAARQLAHELGVHKNTAWYVNVRIRKALAETDQRDLLQDIGSLEATT